MSASIWSPGDAVTTGDTLKTQAFVASAGQKLFTLTRFTYAIGTESLYVFISGMIQRVGVDFTETASNSFTLSEGVAEGTIVYALGFVGVSSILSFGPATDYLSLNVAGAGQAIGRLTYNPATGTISSLQIGGNVLGNMCRDEYILATNTAGSPLVAGEVVYLDGSSAQNPTVKRAANTDANVATRIAGLACEAILNNSQGLIQTTGLVKNINTNSWTEGTHLWLGTGGALTSTKPSSVSSLVYIGLVIKQHATLGQIQLNIHTDYSVSVVPTNTGFKNKLINGDMLINQRGLTSIAAVANGTYLADRWKIQFAGTMVGTFSIDGSTPSEYQASLKYAVTTAQASLGATDFCSIQQVIEGYNARDLIGNPFCITFWVKSSLTGVHCVNFRNSGNDRCYCSEYTINAANTWEQKTILVPGGLVVGAGTWNWNNGTGLRVEFVLGAGSSYRSTPDTWLTATNLSSTNQVNLLATIGNAFSITGVQLELNTAPSLFDHIPYDLESLRCYRYYYKTDIVAFDWIALGWSQSATSFVGMTTFPVPMRIAPTALLQSGTAANYTVNRGGAAGNTVCSAVPTYSQSTKYAGWTAFTVAAGLTSSSAGSVFASNGSGYLAWDTEL